jgi:Flp pilus assembly protein TadD
MSSTVKSSILGMMKSILWVGLVTFVTGCSQLSSKSHSQLDYAKNAQQVAPLATELDQKEEYEFALEIAKLKIERKRYAEAEGLLQKLRKAESDDIRLYRLLAQVYEAQKKTDLSLVAWQQVHKHPKKTIDDASELARLSLIQGEYAPAEIIYQAWLEKSNITLQVTALNNLGFSALLQKKYTDAQDFFEQALQKDPLNSKALNNLKLVKTLVE